MVKKKKKSNRNDTRGYNTGRNNHFVKKKNETLDLVGKSKGTIEVTKLAHQELMILMDEVKKSLDTEKEEEKNDLIGKRIYTTLVDDVSMENKRFVKKVSTLVRKIDGIITFCSLFHFL